MSRLLLSLTALAAFAASVRAEDFAEKLRLAQAQQAAAPSPKATVATVPAVPKPKKSTLVTSVGAGSPRPAPAPTVVPSASVPTPVAATDPLAAITTRLATLESASAAWDRFKFEAFAHLRYDNQDSKKLRGLYARRVETKLTAKLWDKTNGVFGYDFAENKLKDLGLELDGLPFWPGSAPKWKLRLGQFRQNFGIEPQTGSPKVWFAERALIYGGAQDGASTVKLAGERAMGLHLSQQQSLGAVSYSLGLSVANDLSEDQAAGKNKISSTDAFPKQTLDENPSLAARLGFEAALGAVKLGWGASYARDNQNAAFLATRGADQRYDEALGLDLKAEWPKYWSLQGEWVASDSLRGDTGLSLRREGSYLQQSLQPWRFFDAGAPQVELLARYENLQPNVHLNARSLDAATAGLKWTYGDGRQNLLFQYTAFAYRHDFGAAAGTELWVLQNQISF